MRYSYMKRKNMQVVSISEIQRNLHKFNEFDIIEVVDKRRNEIKGYFLDSSYKSVVDNLIRTKEEKKYNLLNIVGIVNGSEELTRDTLRDEKLSKYA